MPSAKVVKQAFVCSFSLELVAVEAKKMDPRKCSRLGVDKRYCCYNFLLKGRL